jgi:hypothetical protein
MYLCSTSVTINTQPATPPTAAGFTTNVCRSNWNDNRDCSTGTESRSIDGFIPTLEYLLMWLLQRCTVTVKMLQDVSAPTSVTINQQPDKTGST